MLQRHTFSDYQVAGLPSTTGSPLGFFRLIQVDVDAFEVHVSSLPTLDDLMAEYREEDPAFDGYYAAAEEELFAEMMTAAEEGRLSRITVERLRLGITQAELARRAGMLQPNISRLEKPGASMNIATARKLAKALSIEDYKVLLP